MLIKTNASGFNHPVPSDITPQGIYQGRRDLIKLMATGAAGRCTGRLGGPRCTGAGRTEARQAGGLGGR